MHHHILQLSCVATSTQQAPAAAHGRSPTGTQSCNSAKSSNSHNHKHRCSNNKQEQVTPELPRLPATTFVFRICCRDFLAALPVVLLQNSWMGKPNIPAIAQLAEHLTVGHAEIRWPLARFRVAGHTAMQCPSRVKLALQFGRPRCCCCECLGKPQGAVCFFIFFFPGNKTCAQKPFWQILDLQLRPKDYTNILQ